MSRVEKNGGIRGGEEKGEWFGWGPEISITLLARSIKTQVSHLL